MIKYTQRQSMVMHYLEESNDNYLIHSAKKSFIQANWMYNFVRRFSVSEQLLIAHDLTKFAFGIEYFQRIIESSIHPMAFKLHKYLVNRDNTNLSYMNAVCEFVWVVGDNNNLVIHRKGRPGIEVLVDDKPFSVEEYSLKFLQ